MASLVLKTRSWLYVRAMGCEPFAGIHPTHGNINQSRLLLLHAGAIPFSHNGVQTLNS